MRVETGLVIPGYLTLSDVCRPVADELPRFFSAIDIQSGPFDSKWLYALPEHERLVRQFRWDVPAFRNSSTHGFRPGALPRLAPHIIVDEWSYYYILHPSEPEALRAATTLASHIGDLSEEFMAGLGAFAQMLLCHGDGWWEVFTARSDWHGRFLATLPDVQERPLSFAGTAP